MHQRTQSCQRLSRLRASASWARQLTPWQRWVTRCVQHAHQAPTAAAAAASSVISREAPCIYQHASLCCHHSWARQATARPLYLSTPLSDDLMRCVLQIGSTILAQAAGVPTLPWSGSGVAVSFADCKGVIPEDTYKKACVYDLDEAIESCQRIGYPIMLKASWGGGGKGIRKVHTDDEVRAVFKQIQGEVRQCCCVHERGRRCNGGMCCPPHNGECVLLHVHELCICCGISPPPSAAAAATTVMLHSGDLMLHSGDHMHGAHCK